MARGKASATINSLLKLAALPMKVGESGAAETAADQFSFLVFEINGETVAISVEQIEGIVDAPRITPLPTPPDGVVGVASVRGRMTLAVSLGTKEGSGRHKQRLILLKGDAQLGLLADRIDDVITVLKKDIQKAVKPKRDTDAAGRVIGESEKCVKRKDRLIPILDVEQIGEI